MPAWVTAGVAEYTARLPAETGFSLSEIAPGHRGRGANPARAVDEEGKRMLGVVDGEALVIALDERGTPWNTEELAAHMREWRERGRTVTFLVGGPDGLHRSCIDRADSTWSLSRLTLPHGMVRVMLAEQLYRAWSLLNGHPYHRA
jgi:23S rRNA (pseudouridine1915-N3)-methyltransferase